MNIKKNTFNPDFAYLQNKRVKSGLNKNIYSLGLISFLTDISSEMVYPLLPVFLSSVLGVSITFIGLIEGTAESAASILKIFSGWISDKLKKRKPIILLGYGLSTIGKPFLYFAMLGWHVLTVRLIDRIGKGLRVAPRDALIAESCPADEKGMAFGIQRAMDNAGAFLGPLLAFILLPLFNNNYRAIFLIAFVPAMLAVLSIVFFLKEPSRPEKDKTTSPVSLSLSMKNMGKDFKIFVLIIAVFTLGNSSNAFLLLRAKDLSIPTAAIPLLWLVYNFFGTVTSVPLGRLSDRIGRKKTIIAGFFIYSAVYFGFAFSNEQYLIWLFIALYGIYNGLSEGVFRAHLADLVTEGSKRGTAYGIFNTVTGIFALPASLLMGLFWRLFGPGFAFSFGASLSLACALMFGILQKEPAEKPQ